MPICSKIKIHLLYITNEEHFDKLHFTLAPSEGMCAFDPECPDGLLFWLRETKSVTWLQ